MGVAMKAKSGPERGPMPHRLRIIGGRWRGRKLDFPMVAAIRPTPDRVRETVFNWLQHNIVDARCLDLFAGSGALGFEALSRGAAHVDFVEREPLVIRYLRETLQRLEGTGEVHGVDSLKWLQTAQRPYDIVFLDPPFGANLLPQVSQALEAGGYLTPHSLIYIEQGADTDVQLPVEWELTRSKTAGQVGYHLARRR
jgi:16S rRNA (guanine966-N2)-methyltransferase